MTPRRDDEVAAWLKRRRDEWRHPRWSDISVTPAVVANWLLDEYRERADYGLALDEDGGDP